MTRARAMVAAVPQGVWTAVAGLALLASLAIAFVIGAGLQVWRGAVGGVAQQPQPTLQPPGSGLVLLPGGSAAPRHQPPHSAPGTSPATPRSPVVRSPGTGVTTGAPRTPSAPAPVSRPAAHVPAPRVPVTPVRVPVVRFPRLVHVPTVGVPTLVHVPVLRVPEVQQGDGDETEAVALGLGQRFATLVLVDGDGEVRGVAHVTLRVAHLGAADQDAVGPAGATPHKAVATIAAGGRHRGPSAARQAAHRVRHLAHRGAHKAAKHGHARHHHSHRGSHRASHRHG